MKLLFLALCALPVWADVIQTNTCTSSAFTGSSYTGGDGSTVFSAQAISSPAGQTPVVCSVDLLATLTTEGPPRMGYLAVAGAGDADGGGGAPFAEGFSITDGIHTISGSCMSGCGADGHSLPIPLTDVTALTIPGVIPFELGVPFHLDIHAIGGIVGTPPHGSGGGAIQIEFSVYDLSQFSFDGTQFYLPIPIFLASDAPEPASIALSGSGLLLLAGWRFRRSLGISNRNP